MAVREETLLDAVSEFFNRHVFGPDRIHLAKASIPAAAHHVLDTWQRTSAALDRHIAELEGDLRNLTRTLRKEHDHESAIYRHVTREITEVDRELTDVQQQQARLQAARPQAQEDTSLLDFLPLQAVDLGMLATDRLRRFLDAFEIEIHYDHRTRRATLCATISGGTLDHLARIAAQVAQPAQPAHNPAARHKNGPADGGARPSTGHSSVGCPRRVPPNMGNGHDQR